MSKSEEIYNIIKKAIVNRRLFPGSQLKEKEISDKYGSSRTPIRHAFRMLEKEGLVENIPNRGTYVVNPSIDEIHYAYDLRVILERVLAKEIAGRAEKEEIKILEDLVAKEYKLYEKNELLIYIKINKEFHMQLANLSKNIFLIEAIEKILNIIHVHLILYDKYNKVSIENLRGLDEHRLIIKHLKEGNAGALEKVMVDHSTRTFKEIVDRKNENENENKNKNDIF